MTLRVPPGLPGGIGVGTGTCELASGPFFVAAGLASGLRVCATEAVSAAPSSVAPRTAPATTLKVERDMGSSWLGNDHHDVGDPEQRVETGQPPLESHVMDRLIEPHRTGSLLHASEATISEATIAEATTAGKAAAGPDMIPVVIE